VSAGAAEVDELVEALRADGDGGVGDVVAGLRGGDRLTVEEDPDGAVAAG
jgi:hypothetical protein